MSFYKRKKLVPAIINKWTHVAYINLYKGRHLSYALEDICIEKIKCSFI